MSSMHTCHHFSGQSWARRAGWAPLDNSDAPRAANDPVQNEMKWNEWMNEWMNEMCEMVIKKMERGKKIIDVTYCNVFERRSLDNRIADEDNVRVWIAQRAETIKVLLSLEKWKWKWEWSGWMNEWMRMWYPAVSHRSKSTFLSCYVKSKKRKRGRIVFLLSRARSMAMIFQ